MTQIQSKSENVFQKHDGCTLHGATPNLPPGPQLIIADKVVVVPTQACGPSVHMGLPSTSRGSPALEGLPARRSVKSNGFVFWRACRTPWFSLSKMSEHSLPVSFKTTDDPQKIRTEHLRDRLKWSHSEFCQERMRLTLLSCDDKN